MKKRFDPLKARQLASAITRADLALVDYLNQHFPQGYRCDVLLSATQKNPTPATIWGVWGAMSGSTRGTIAVEIDGAKQYSRQRIRRLAPNQVLNVRPAAAPQEGGHHD